MLVTILVALALSCSSSPLEERELRLEKRRLLGGKGVSAAGKLEIWTARLDQLDPRQRACKLAVAGAHIQGKCTPNEGLSPEIETTVGSTAADSIRLNVPPAANTLTTRLVNDTNGKHGNSVVQRVTGYLPKLKWIRWFQLKTKDTSNGMNLENSSYSKWYHKRSSYEKANDIQSYPIKGLNNTINLSDAEELGLKHAPELIRSYKKRNYHMGDRFKRKREDMDISMNITNFITSTESIKDIALSSPPCEYDAFSRYRRSLLQYPILKHTYHPKKNIFSRRKLKQIIERCKRQLGNLRMHGSTIIYHGQTPIDSVRKYNREKPPNSKVSDYQKISSYKGFRNKKYPIDKPKLEHGSLNNFGPEISSFLDNKDSYKSTANDSSYNDTSNAVEQVKIRVKSVDEKGLKNRRKRQLEEYEVPSRLLSDVRYSAAVAGYSVRLVPQSDDPGAVAKGGGWPVRRVCEVAGDLLLGGLMMVHERSDVVTCGPVMLQGGIQALETMLYTLDVINSQDWLPFRLGAHILDDCDKDTYGLEMAVDFIKGSISNIEDAEYHCNKTQVRKVISGVVGAASSVTSIQVANLLRLFKIPQVSFWSTSPELSNKQRFEYFTRTIPSDHHQAQAMVEIVKRLGWSYVSIIYEESNYGIKAFEELEQLLARANICIAVKEKLAKDSGVAEDNAYDNVVLRLQTKPRARGAIVFASDQEVAGLMRAVRRVNATGSFSWIGSDGWSARSLVSEGSEPEVEGTLSVQPQANPVRGFDNYFLNLTVENNKRNPWFVEFWEDHFECRYPNRPATPYNWKYERACTTRERLTRENTAFENQLQFVSDAVMALAVALRDMHRDRCRGHRRPPGLCSDMIPTKGPDLLKYLRKANFMGLSGDKFHFDVSGDGPARYNIIHFKQTQPGVFQWVHVGEYVEGELRMNMTEIQFKVDQPHPPESVCSLPCELGQAKTYVEGESCCWHCFNCSTYQIRHPLEETVCVACPLGTRPDRWHQVCLHIPEDFLRAGSAWAIGAMSLSLAGCLATLLVAGVFVHHNDTPVVKAAGRELTYVLLAGILLCYLITFALVLRPSDLVCGVQRFGAGFCFTVVYAALLTKTNRISRIFNAGKRTSKRPGFISPRSQLIICSGLCSVQILINVVWMVVSPPRAVHHYPTREDNLLVCSSYVDASYMIAFGFPIVLIVVCTVYAVLTRNIPEAFNESKHIGFTMYTTCVIWLAFVPLYFGTGNNMALRITSMSVTISLSASVTVACLFSPKLYIILIHPERNVRQSMMPHGPRAAASAAPAPPRQPATEATYLPKTIDMKPSENHLEKAKPVETMSKATQTNEEETQASNGPPL